MKKLKYLLGPALIAGIVCLAMPFYHPQAEDIQHDGQFSLWLGEHCLTDWAGAKPEVTGVVYAGISNGNMVLTVFIRKGQFPVFVPEGTREITVMGKWISVLEASPTNFTFVLKGG